MKRQRLDTWKEHFKDDIPYTSIICILIIILEFILLLNNICNMFMGNLTYLAVIILILSISFWKSRNPTIY